MVPLDFTSALLAYGPLGIICAVFLWFIINDRKNLREDQKTERAKMEQLTKSSIEGQTAATEVMRQISESHTRLIDSNQTTAAAVKSMSDQLRRQNTYTGRRAA